MYAGVWCGFTTDKEVNQLNTHIQNKCCFNVLDAGERKNACQRPKCVAFNTGNYLHSIYKQFKGVFLI